MTISSTSSGPCASHPRRATSRFCRVDESDSRCKRWRTRAMRGSPRSAGRGAARLALALFVWRDSGGWRQIVQRESKAKGWLSRLQSRVRRPDASARPCRRDFADEWPPRDPRVRGRDAAIRLRWTGENRHTDLQHPRHGWQAVPVRAPLGGSSLLLARDLAVDGKPELR